MAALQNFRSALNGFNREDVVHYIEYINTAHASQVGQLNTELQQLRAELKSLREQPKPDNSALLQELAETKTANETLTQSLEEKTAQCTALELSLAEAEAKAAALEQTAQDRKERCAQLQEEVDTLREQLEQARQEASRPQTEEELEAYRRAERAERLASARVAQLYAQANGILADSTVRVDETANQVSDMVDQVAVQLAQLQTSVLASKGALKDAAAALYAVRPIEVEE